MKQRRIVTVLAIIAVTGAVSVPNSLAMAWRLDISNRHVVDRGGLEWNPLIHTVAGVDVPTTHDPEYETLGHPEHGPIPIPNQSMDRTADLHTGEYKPGSLSNEGFNSSEKESSGSSNSPFSGFLYGGIPETPSADPMIEDLSRAPR